MKHWKGWKWWYVVSVPVLAGVLLYAASGTIVTWTGKGSRRGTVEFTIESPSMGSAANFLPGTTGTNALGTSALRFSDVQTVNATVSGTLTAAGVNVSGGFVVPTVDIDTTTPTVAGQLVKTSAFVIYIGTATTSTSSWTKVGGQ